MAVTTDPNQNQNQNQNPPQNDDDVDDDVDVNADDDAGEGEGEGEEKLTEAQLQEKLSNAELELAKARRALKKANREAAARRVALKEKNQKGKDDGEGDDENPLAAENARLKAELKERDRKTFIEKEKSRVSAFATELGFKHPEDALVLGGIEFDDDGAEPLEDDEIKNAVRALARKRPELLKEQDVIDTDSQRRGKRDTLPIDEDEIARQFGVRNYTPSKKE